MPSPKSGKQYALRNLVADLYRDGFFPIPDNKFALEKLLISELLKIPIFKKGSLKRDTDLYLHGDKDGQKLRLRDGDPLLLAMLASNLISHFKRIPIYSEVERIGRVQSALYDLLSFKKEFIAAGIVDEKTLLKTLNKITVWMGRYLEYISKGLSPNQRTQLVKDLYACFRNSVQNIHMNTAFHCIAHILKGFGIEEGTEKRIYERIRKDYRRKIS